LRQVVLVTWKSGFNLIPRLTPDDDCVLTQTGRSYRPLRSFQTGRRRSFLVGHQARSVHGHERVQGEVAVPVRPGRRVGQDARGGEDLFPGRAGTDLRQGGFRSFEMARLRDWEVGGDWLIWEALMFGAILLGGLWIETRRNWYTMGTGRDRCDERRSRSSRSA
jgi:hypothetical protein